jgi:GntR family transcriptional regulator, rspAB operon transcriptional repressor
MIKPMATRAAVELSDVLPKLDPVDLTSQVQDILREKILNGDLAPDQTISARTLGDALGVSMTPVRNALDRLAGEGIVVMSPRRGTRVAAPSFEDMEECYDLRLVLEGHAAERAARRLTDGGLAELERRWLAFGAKVPAPPAKRGHREPKQTAPPAQLAASEQTADRTLVRELATLDREFHEQVIQLSGSGRLLQLYRVLEMSLSLGRLYYLGIGPTPGEGSHREHRQIVDALATRDPLIARAAAEEHVQHARDGMMTALRRQV